MVGSFLTSFCECVDAGHPCVIHKMPASCTCKTCSAVEEWLLRTNACKTREDIMCFFDEFSNLYCAEIQTPVFTFTLDLCLTVRENQRVSVKITAREELWFHVKRCSLCKLVESLNDLLLTRSTCPNRAQKAMLLSVVFTVNDRFTSHNQNIEDFGVSTKQASQLSKLASMFYVMAAGSLEYETAFTIAGTYLLFVFDRENHDSWYKHFKKNKKRDLLNPYIAFICSTDTVTMINLFLRGASHIKPSQDLRRALLEAGENGELCPVCGKAETASARFADCSKCRVARYCSKECQRKDWVVHKLVCKR